MAKSKQERANEKLIEAVENWDDAAFIRALRNGADADALDEDGHSPLFGAVYNHQEQMVEGLIGAGADVNLAGPDGWTPLHEAARSGNTKTLLVLLDAGASLNSFCAGHSELIGGYPIHEASGDAVSFLAERGVDIEARDALGRTPLHFRAGNCDAEGIRTLLGLGANPFPMDQEGKSPLEYMEPTSKHFEMAWAAFAPAIAERDRLALQVSTAQARKTGGQTGTCNSCGRPAHSGRCRF